MDSRQTRQFLVITLAIVYSYSHFVYLVMSRVYLVIVPIVIIRFRCFQLSFYLEMVFTRLTLINNELDAIEKNNLNDLANDSAFKKLLILKGMFSDVWKTATLLNDCFSWSIAAITSEIFLELTINSYIIYLGISSCGFKYLGLVIYFLGVMPIVFAFLLGCRNAERCTRKVIL